MFEFFSQSPEWITPYIAWAYGIYWFWVSAFAVKIQYKYHVTASTPFVIFPVSVKHPEWIGLHSRDNLSGSDFMFVFLQSLMLIALLMLVMLLTVAFLPTIVVVFGWTWYWFCVHWPRIYKAVQERDRRYV